MALAAEIQNEVVTSKMVPKMRDIFYDFVLNSI